MANLQFREASIETFTPLPPGMDVDGMAKAFTEAMISTAASITPCEKRSQGPSRWCASVGNGGRNVCGVVGEGDRKRASVRGSRQQQSQEGSVNS